MANAPTPPTATAPPTDIADLSTRLKNLRAEIETTRQELRSVQGKLKNRDPGLLQTLKNENAKLKQRRTGLEAALFGLMAESLLPKDANEAKTFVENLRLTAVEHCKKTNVDTSLWKKIES